MGGDIHVSALPYNHPNINKLIKYNVVRYREIGKRTKKKNILCNMLYRYYIIHLSNTLIYN